MDSQLQSLSQTSCAQMKLKIAVAPLAFFCIFFLAEILSSACQVTGPSLFYPPYCSHKEVPAVGWLQNNWVCFVHRHFSQMQIFTWKQNISLSPLGFFLIKSLLWLEQSLSFLLSISFINLASLIDLHIDCFAKVLQKKKLSCWGEGRYISGGLICF